MKEGISRIFDIHNFLFDIFLFIIILQPGTP